MQTIKSVNHVNPILSFNQHLVYQALHRYHKRAGDYKGVTAMHDK